MCAYLMLPVYRNKHFELSLLVMVFKNKSYLCIYNLMCFIYFTVEFNLLGQHNRWIKIQLLFGLGPLWPNLEIPIPILGLTHSVPMMWLCLRHTNLMQASLPSACMMQADGRDAHLSICRPNTYIIVSLFLCNRQHTRNTCLYIHIYPILYIYIYLFLLYNYVHDHTP